MGCAGMMSKILLAEDDTDMRRFLVKALDQPVHIIDEAMKHFSGGTAQVRR